MSITQEGVKCLVGGYILCEGHPGVKSITVGKGRVTLAEDHFKKVTVKLLPDGKLRFAVRVNHDGPSIWFRKDGEIYSFADMGRANGDNVVRVKPLIDIVE